MLIVVDDPEHVPYFIGYVKAEIAHVINLLLGRQKKTIWAEGYDSPHLLTADDVIRYINYIYQNPVKANLVDSIEEYPGVSSWNMFKNDKLEVELNHVPRNLVKTLPTAALSISEQKRLVEFYQKLQLPKATFVLEPFAWLKSFPGFPIKQFTQLKERILNDVKFNEGQLAIERSKSKKQTIGSTALRRQSMLLIYTPKKFSRRMICICQDKNLRKTYIEHFKKLALEARKVFLEWKIGNLLPTIPLGMFAPRMPVLRSAISLHL